MPPHPIVAVVHDIRSAYNVGSIFRTADCAGLAGLVLVGITATPEHRGVAKTALGAEDSVPWRHVASIDEALAQLRAEGYTIAALERAPGGLPPAEVPADAFPLALVLGNEVHGVPDAVIEAADLVVELPQYGAKESLNVAVAFGIAAYGLVDRVRVG